MSEDKVPSSSEREPEVANQEIANQEVANQEVANQEVANQEVWSRTAFEQKWLVCNGLQFRKLVGVALGWLDKHHQRVNELNVFPVPDGDTGTNMLLTMRSAYKKVEGSDELHVGKMAQAVSQGALMGARGNSGVILSQIWRGLAKEFAEKETFNGGDLAQALVEASKTAYKGVMTPVEGTLLTVIREASEEAVDAAEKSGDLRFILERIFERAQQSLERTPELLPVLKQAGVVDSGGQGLVYLFEGMVRYINGLPVAEAGQSPSLDNVQMPAQAFAIPEGGSLENPYDVQFILQGENLDVTTVRNRIDSMGDSTVVVGDERIIKVHIHVKDPGEPLSYGISLGAISDVVVENMQEQMEEIVAGGQAEKMPTPTVPIINPGQIGVITVAPGAGLTHLFYDLGAISVVDGGQTNNPSTEEIFQTIQDAPTDKVVILPNNKNIQMAAESARDLSSKQVCVVPTRTIPQGVGAMIAYGRDGDVEQIAAAMTTAAQEVVSGEITTATRSVKLNGVAVNSGDVIGLAEGNICAAGNSWKTVLPATLDKMGVADRELVSIYYGEEVTAADAEGLGSQIEALYPDVEVEILAGGQAHYFFILGAE